MKFTLLHIEGKFKNSQGYTLIELLAVITLSSMLFISVFSLYAFGVNTYTEYLDKLYVQQNARHALFVLTDNIRMAKDISFLSKDRITIMMFNGNEITFLFKNGVLYRESNFIKNPIAYINTLSFAKLQDKHSIEIELSCAKRRQIYNLKTIITPLGICKDNF